MSALRNLAHRPARAARRKTETAERAPWFTWPVRAGFVARAITYGVIGGLALAIALGAGSDGATANQEGALALIGRAFIGRLALGVICAGLLAYAVWKLTQAGFGRGPEGGGGTELKDRVANAAGGIVYIGFAAVAIRALAGSGGNSSGEPSQATGGVLGWPGGPVIVGIAGAGLLAISLYQLYDAFRGGFAKEAKTERMGRGEHNLYLALGRIGLSARALVFALIGYFLLRAAIEYDPSQSIGIDGALARLHHRPWGAELVGLVAAGLLVFAVFSLLEARHRRL